MIGAVQPEPEQQAGEQRQADQREIVAYIAETEKRDIAEEAVGLRGVVGFDAPNELGGILEDEEERVGHQDQHHLVATIKETQHAALEQRSQRQRDRERRAEHQQIAEERRPDIAAVIPADRARRGIGADGEQAAMGEVENVEDAEYERQSDRHDEQPGRVDHAVDQDRCSEFHALSLD